MSAGDLPGYATDAAPQVQETEAGTIGGQVGPQVVQYGLKGIKAVQLVGQVQGRLPGNEGVVALVDVGAKGLFRLFVVEGNVPPPAKGRGQERAEGTQSTQVLRR